MLKRGLFAVTGAIMLLVVAATAALAWSDDVQGDPGITHESADGYYLWRDENGMHLRTHGPGEEHLFTARLDTDGTFIDVDSVRLESRDKFAVINGGHTIVMRFHTYDATDGLNFRINGGTKLRLALRLDSEFIDTDSIYLGALSRHPDSNPFVIKR